MASERHCREKGATQNGEGSKEVAVVFTTPRHRCKLQEGGYLYVFDKMSTDGQKKFWRCEKKSTCNARIHTDVVTNMVLKRSTAHNHPPALLGFERKFMKRPLEMSMADDEVPVKRSSSPGKTLLQGFLNTSGFQPNPTAEKLRNLKKEYDEMVSDSRSRLSLPEALASYPRPNNFSGITAGTDVNLFARTDNVGHSEADVSGQQTPTSSGTANEHHLVMARGERSEEIDDLEQFFNGGLIIWSDDISKIIEDGEQFCKMAQNSILSKCFSLLIKGGENTGKTCLAALIAKNSDIPCVKLCLPEKMLELDEEAKKAKLIDLFEEACQLPQCILFLDAIELLIGYCEVGNHYSNTILQTLKLLLKKGQPSQNNRLLIVATVTERCAKEFGLQHQFSATVEVPLLTKVEHLMAVIEDSNLFPANDCKMFGECLAHETSSYSVGIKCLLTAIELVKFCGATNRVRVLFRKLSEWKQ